MFVSLLMSYCCYKSIGKKMPWVGPILVVQLRCVRCSITDDNSTRVPLTQELPFGQSKMVQRSLLKNIKDQNCQCFGWKRSNWEKAKRECWGVSGEYLRSSCLFFLEKIMSLLEVRNVSSKFLFLLEPLHGLRLEISKYWRSADRGSVLGLSYDSWDSKKNKGFIKS